MSKIRIRQTHSSIGCPPRQCATLRGLGLRRIGHCRDVADTPAIRGMIAAIPHLVHIEADDMKKPKS